MYFFLSFVFILSFLLNFFCCWFCHDVVFFGMSQFTFNRLSFSLNFFQAIRSGIVVIIFLFAANYKWFNWFYLSSVVPFAKISSMSAAWIQFETISWIFRVFFIAVEWTDQWAGIWSSAPSNLRSTCSTN